MTRHTTNLELFPRRWERALTPEEVRAGFERLRRDVAEAVRERAGGKAELSRDEVENVEAQLHGEEKL